MMQAERLSANCPMTTVNLMSPIAFRFFCAGVFEQTPWIAAKAARKRNSLRAHPMLGVGAARRGDFTESSKEEQAGLGLDRREGDEGRAFAALNLAYQKRFGFLFVIAMKGRRDRAAVLAGLSQRFESTPEVEREAALAEVVKIAGFRLDALVDDTVPA
jgi:2-oxo-4-hydroxy-4-carboxy-5-ureidoimidazoline decarboxylase